MTRIDFLVRLQTRIAAAVDLNISRNKLSKIVDCVFDEVFETVLKYGEFRVKEFGLFYSKLIDPRDSYNIKTKTIVTLPAMTLFKFKPFDRVKKSINILQDGLKAE